MSVLPGCVAHRAYNPHQLPRTRRMATLQPSQLSAYANRISFPGGLLPQQGASLQLLTDVVIRHQRTIPFENLSLVHHHFKQQDRGRICIDFDSVFDKLVTRRRGGYCFENNSLLAAVLRTLDFQLYTTAARVIPDPHAGSTPDEVVMNGLDHQLSLVALNECIWAVDVGFGSKVPREPIPLLSFEGMSNNVRHKAGAPLHRVRRGVAGSKAALPQLGQEHYTGWYMQTWSASRECWEDLYFFMEVEYGPRDYAVLNAATSAPSAWFSTKLVAAIQTERGRITLDDRQLKEFAQRKDGKLELVSDGHLQIEENRDAALAKYFGIEYSSSPKA